MAIFAGAIGLSAFLLFWIEPLVGQIVLPVFGGTPAVWATVLVFFQGVLLLGYLYSHASVTWLGPRRGALLHIAVAVAALGWIVILPTRQEDLRAGDLPAALDVLRILVIAVGPPVFVLTATTPLLSAWFAATHGQHDRGDPYRLYALSNGASLAALLAYPFIIGPLVGLSRQEALWTVVFFVLCGALSVAAIAVLQRARTIRAGALVVNLDPPSSDADAAAGQIVGRGPGIAWGRRARWLLLAAVPSGLLAAVTNFIAVDLIAAPLLWIGPLGLYLGSFIVAFSARGRRLVPAAVALAPAIVTLLWIPIGSAGGWPLLPLIVLEWGGFAIVATALHGRLAQDRPSAERLTEFYLVQSVGGMTGGAFVAIVAPLIFPGVWEYPILLAAALGVLAVTGTGRSRTGARSARDQTGRRLRVNLRPFFSGGAVRLVPYIALAVIVVATMVLDHSIALAVALRWFIVGGLILLVGAQPRFLAVATGLTLVVATLVIPSPALLRDRSFFAVTEVVRTADGRWTELMNGTTVHGVQSTDPSMSRQPTSYYASSGPLGDVFAILGRTNANAAIAVVGLGAGTIAAYEQPTQTMTYFEIDPLVVRVATNARYFTYLADAPVRPTIVLGDARLSLRSVHDGSFDLVVLDAFSSDAIPTHLLTVEALADDRRVLRPDGVIAVHVSNRYYDLAPALGAAGERLGLTVLERRYAPTPSESAAGAAPSIWVVATGDPATADRFRADGWQATTDAGVVPLTDDHPDVLRFLDIGG
ncbi:MAG TPA: fused MFS/spermidine synthase [Cellulomonadaceae bacterium]|nr:fused MFS/spermidine synthase [Cellulomonadaceae bacterium]